ncbi:basic proline-rich protein-like [Chrysemys picta bellii]|uniref:basic proline-rich protein-like n=1 Tax=Chrysemys picta bellii TaxID=8478 RepID=UPI0032B18567
MAAGASPKREMAAQLPPGPRTRRRAQARSGSRSSHRLTARSCSQAASPPRRLSQAVSWVPAPQLSPGSRSAQQGNQPGSGAGQSCQAPILPEPERYGPARPGSRELPTGSPSKRGAPARPPDTAPLPAPRSRPGLTPRGARLRSAGGRGPLWAAAEQRHLAGKPGAPAPEPSPAQQEQGGQARPPPGDSPQLSAQPGPARPSGRRRMPSLRQRVPPARRPAPPREAAPSAPRRTGGTRGTQGRAQPLQFRCADRDPISPPPRHGGHPHPVPFSPPT